MRFSLPHNKQQTKGFTLVEMLVVAPVVILVIGAFIGVMTAIVGDVLITRDRSDVTFETQDALDRIEQDTRLATQFLTTTGTLASPQGSDSNFAGTAAFTNTNNLILSVNATDKNPTDSTRQIVYRANQPLACGASQSFNTIFPVSIVYFIKSGSLWRRTIVPTYNTSVTVDANTVCVAPWQRNSCTPPYTASARCQTNDVEVMQNIASMDVKYYTDATSVTELTDANAGSASTIEVTINAAKTTAGRSFTTSGVLRVDKLN
jgi:type II secretory pathway pseudopilin PulG